VSEILAWVSANPKDLFLGFLVFCGASVFFSLCSALWVDWRRNVKRKKSDPHTMNTQDYANLNEKRFNR
jgi:hypothetical protein